MQLAQADAQRIRVREALKKGPVTQKMFEDPTCDGGPRIHRIAPRVYELRLRGWDIQTKRANDLAVYHLLGEPMDSELALAGPKELWEIKGRGNRGEPTQKTTSPAQRAMWEDA